MNDQVSDCEAEKQVRAVRHALKMAAAYRLLDDTEGEVAWRRMAAQAALRAYILMGGIVNVPAGGS